MKSSILHKFFGYLLLTAIILVTSACEDQAAVEKGEVLAIVDGSPITRVDLDIVLVKTIGYSNALTLDKEGQQKFLESLVISRAMANAVRDELSEAQMRKIERETKAYREQLLVKKYLNRHAEPRNVTNEKIKNYYDTYPERFGGKILRRYEMIFGATFEKGDQRQSLIQVMTKIKDKTAWQLLVSKLNTQGQSVQYRTGLVDTKIFHPRLQALVESLKINQSSELTFIEGKPYIVRIISEQQQISRPLADVRTDIRKILVLEEFRKATKIAAKEILEKVSVEYMVNE